MHTLPLQTTFGAPGICATAAAKKFLLFRERLGREQVLDHREAHMQSVRELIDEHWPLITRRIQRVQHMYAGKAPFEEVCAVIMRCAALRPTDDRAVATIVRRCIVDTSCKDPDCNDYLVDLKRLYECTVVKEKARRPGEWETRFKADGVMDQAIQRHTTGVERNAWRYMRQYRGAPFAQTSDAACVEALTSQHHNLLFERMRSVLMQHAEMMPFADIRHPDHPEHKKLRVAVYEHSTSSSALRLKDPIHKRSVQLRDGAEALLTHPACRTALLSLQKGFLGEKEIEEMLLILDPKHRGFVRVEEVMKRFAFELLKPKAARNTLGRQNHDGTATALEWPGGEAPEVGVPRKPFQLHHHHKRPHTARPAAQRASSTSAADATALASSPRKALAAAAVPFVPKPPPPTSARRPTTVAVESARR